MGNHEYCGECGESDFHWGRSCDPKKLAKKQQERAKQKAYERELTIAARALQKDLEKLGHRVYNERTHIEVWPRLPGEKPYKPLKCMNCGKEHPHKCAIKGCKNIPGGNVWDCYKYCDECDAKGKR